MAEQNKSKGFVALYRSIQDHWLWESGEMNDFQAWVDLLLMANHEDRKVKLSGELVIVKRGQRITSIRKLSERWNWSNTKVTRYLDLLEKDGMIERKSDTKKTVISIVNYDVYQHVGNEKTTPKRHRSDTVDTRSIHGSDTVAHKQQLKQLETINNNDKQVYGEFKNVLLTIDELEKLKTNFTDYMDRIERLSQYVASSGKKYKSHYATILNWARRDKEKMSQENTTKEVDYSAGIVNDPMKWVFED